MAAIQYLMFPLPECCATCREWGLFKYFRMTVPVSNMRGDDVWCPAQEAFLDDVCLERQFTSITCEKYKVEPLETDAVVLFFELSRLYEAKESYETP